MFDLVVSLTFYKSKHGEYPRALNRLVPEFSPALPLDSFTGQPFVYQRLKDGFLLYSIGTNGRDDQGLGYDDREGADDIAIRVPAD
jgi:hypothetical protein